MKALRPLIFCLALAGLACGSIRPTPSAEPPTGTPPEPTTLTSATAPASSTPPAAPAPQEAILIRTPGNGSRLVGAVHVEGEADPTFEQHLAVQVVALDEEPFPVLAQQSVIIGAEAGQRGPFSVDLVFDMGGFASDERPGAIQVISISPRDGGITHLASAQVTLAISGEISITRGDILDERIAIFSPVPAAVVSGGVVHVEGFALASFEQTLLVEVLDADGNAIGSAPVTVEAPDLGFPGPFAVDVAYVLAAAGPGRVVVRDISPAFGQDIHRASVDVRLEP